MTPPLRSLRAVQVGLAAVAVLGGLAWADASSPSHPLGSDSLTVGFEAPAANATGPWPAGHVFTERAAGVPLDVAPRWNVTARHRVDGLDEREGAWSARVEVEKVGGDGRPWWREERALVLARSDGSASVALDAGALVADARAKDAAVRTPGRLDVRLVFEHASVVVVRGAPQALARTASLLLQPGESYVSVVATDDGGTWADAAGRPMPWVPLASVALALALEPLARRAALREPAWARARGVTVVEVADARPPPDAARCDLPSALRAAKETGAAVLVDRRRGVAVVKGAVALVAPLEPVRPSFRVVPRADPDPHPAPVPGLVREPPVRLEELSLANVFTVVPEPDEGRAAPATPPPAVPPPGDLAKRFGRPRADGDDEAP